MKNNVFNEEDGNAKLNLLLQDLKTIISNEVEKLKRQIMSQPIPSRSYFDMLRNWWNNLVHGHDTTSNPYYHRNRLGALGYAESYSKKNELDILKESALILDEAVGTTKFEKLLDNWASQLKTKLTKFVQGCISKGKCDAEKIDEPESTDVLPEPPVTDTETGTTSTTTSSTTTTTTVPPSPIVTTTTTTPVPVPETKPEAEKTDTSPPKEELEDPEVIDFNIFNPKLSEKQKAKVASDFAPYLNLSSDEKKKLNDKGNYYLGIKPEGAFDYKIDGVDLDLPFFLAKDDPRWKILHTNYNTVFTNILKRQRRVEAPRTGGWIDGLKVALSDAFDTDIMSSKKAIGKSNFKNLMSLFVSKFIELIQANPGKYMDEYLPLIKLMMKNKEQLAYNAFHDDEVLDMIIQTLQRLPSADAYEDLKMMIQHSVHAVNFPEEDQQKENNNILSNKTKLHEYYKKQIDKIKLNKDQTLYERTLECLEKLRSGSLFFN